jgi:hypothetical protein
VDAKLAAEVAVGSNAGAGVGRGVKEICNAPTSQLAGVLVARRGQPR